MNWNKLTSETQLEALLIESQQKPVLIFKHSTRCSISSMALDRMLRNWKVEDTEKIIPYYLDLIAFRTVSDQVAERLGITHESPQLLLLHRGEVVYHASHYNISYSDVMTRALEK